MKKLSSKLAWIDENLLFFLSLFLLIFIPLYPKLPLFEAIPGYLVRVRLEDILIFITGIVFAVQLFRKKINWQTSFHFLIIGYALIGFISLLIAGLLQQTIPLEIIHLSKSFLHYFRYLEYFSLFIFMYAGIKNQQQVKVALISLVVILNLIFLYGFGQRYLQWPAFSTMNREYSKGQSLILTPDIKLHSTFGGHYDLAAYLVIILPLVLAWLLRAQNRLFKVWLGLSILAGGWLLVESASKTALAACAVGLGGVIWFSLYQRWGVIKATLISLLVGLFLGGSAVGGLYMWKKPTLYKLAPFLRPAGYETPIDVQAHQLDESWSENARKYGLSMGIRLDTLWPNALKGFSTNPFTGKGYATLNKRGVNEFTEADSTDNNFLRVLGETGILGFIAFFGLIWLIIKTLLIKLPKDDLNQSLVVGFMAATGGLFINAFIIDVFAASKVAFTYWALAGLSLKSITLINQSVIEKKESLRFKNTLNWLKKFWPVLIAGIALIFLIHKRPFTEYSLVKSFALSANQTKYVATTKCMVEQNLKECLVKYEPGIGVTYSVYLLPFYLLYQEPAVFYFANLILVLISVVLINSVLSKVVKNSWNKFFILAIIFTMPLFYNLPVQSSPANLYLPLVLLLIFKIIKQKSFSKLKRFNWVLVGLLILHLIILEYFTGLTGSILSSWRDTYRPSNYVAIRRANRYLSSKIIEGKPAPILLNNIQPVLFDLYGKNDYQIQPINDSDLNSYKELIKNSDQELFITNANVEQEKLINEVFEKYKHQFGITLREMDCRQKCNYYQLLTDEIIIPQQPQIWNNKILPQNLTNLKILVLNDMLISEIGTGKFPTPKKLSLIQQLAAQNPDLIFITDDAKKEKIKNNGQLFWQRFQSELDVPIVVVPSNFSSPKYAANTPQYQRFIRGESLFITLDAAGHHRGPAQNLFLYDTLLQLEKHPKIKKVYFISNDDQWLQQHPDNYYFWKDFPQTLEKFEDVEFEFIYPQEIELNS